MQRSTVTSGSIPEKLVLICQHATTVHRYWDWRGQDQNGESLVVKPAFVSDASNAKTIKTGMLWAGRERWDPVTQRSVSYEPELVERDNAPISGVRIFSLDIRSEGGRAYKVVLPDNIYVDLREDVLLDAMLHAGVSPGGVLGGEYVFARVASQMKLVRVGSELHQSLLTVAAKGKMHRLSNDELKPGHVYETKSGKRAAFLGWVTSKTITVKEDCYCYGQQRFLRGNTVVHKRISLWWESNVLNEKYRESSKQDVEHAWQQDLKLTNGCCLSREFVFKKDHTMIAEVPKLTEAITAFLPADPISTVQQATSANIANVLTDAQSAGSKPLNSYADRAIMQRNYTFHGQVCRFYAAGLVNMAPVGGQLPVDLSYVGFKWPSIDGKPQVLASIY